jgi:hypothetical protein
MTMTEQVSSPERDPSKPGWTPVCAMPNVTLDEPIEASSAALVPCSDERVRLIGRQRPDIETFVSAFRNEFGIQIWPTIGLVREDALHISKLTTAFGGFRDAVCVSAIVTGQGIIHSDAFDVYPWFPNPRFEGRISAITPALVGIHDVEQLRPQPAPALGRRSLSPSQIDQPLLGAILARWQRCFVDGEDSIEDRRLFRALEMARAASKMPGGSDATEYDAGRAVALWVSAFEILAHDGRRSDFRRVLSLLNHVQWLNQKLEIKDRTVGKDKRISTNLAGSIYDRLYIARNHFLHGDLVTAQTLMLDKCRKHVHLFAAPLFRLALTGSLNLRFSDEDRGRAKRMAFNRPQRLAEDAILMADKAPAPGSISRRITSL